jgi:Histidine kinase-, DNA gyrase B-, and HSP90-like ATPase
VELVKNSYDADATRVVVRFEGDNPLIPDRLVITDDGHGMTLDTVLTGWFEPGTVAKKTAVRSPGGRLLQGAKGVGRFAAARLAESLYLETKTSDGEDEVRIDDPRSTKNEQARVFPFTRELRRTLEAQRKLTEGLDSPYVFCHLAGVRVGKRFSYGGVLQGLAARRSSRRRRARAA